MDRRQFVKEVLLWTAGLSLGGPSFKITPLQGSPSSPDAWGSQRKGLSLTCHKSY
jgi:hypothetical protein